ncbi:hypothetical protein H4J02_04685 [Protaetiibacter sp. SSC-01]|uniref:hypothetical protein n=1 Tax=Protaetiibacter sp. SSC-01 TaxID=2759943 RepID=UPI001656DBCB|nr:hypothetical protein [Protaetiibacter sp. SSC-01]QNO38321.1 hypothetical protein H4J02_04685 [Protaetiibacter sp. SSC-01]
MPATTTSIGLRALQDRQVAFIDLSCRRCDTCRDGGPLWCPVRDGDRELGLVAPAALAEQLRDALLCAAGIDEALPRTFDPAPVLITGATARAVALFTHAGVEPIIADIPESEVRARLAERHESGRAGLVIATDDLRQAVKAVRRGSTVVGAPGAALPSVTEVVQREVAIVVPRSIDALVERVTGVRWDAAIAALHTEDAA